MSIEIKSKGSAMVFNPSTVTKVSFGVAYEFENQLDAMALSDYLKMEEPSTGYIDVHFNFLTGSWRVTQYVRLLEGADIKPEGEPFIVCSVKDMIN